MSMRGQIIELRRAAKGMLKLEDNPAMKKALGCAAHFALGFTLSAARIFGSFGPFGIGFTAQAGTGLPGISCLLGSIIGYLTVGGFDWGVRYAAAVVLVFTASFIFQDFPAYKSVWFMPFVAACAALLTSILNTLGSFVSISRAIPILTETFLAGGSTYFFKIALSREERTTESAELRHGISVVILVGCILMALSGISFFGTVSPGRVIAMLIVMTSALKNGPMFASATGVALGISMDLAGGGPPFYTMAYTFAGLLSGVFAKHGRLFFTLSYVLANAVAVVWTYDTVLRTGALYEGFVASVVLLILPQSALSLAGGILQTAPAGGGEAGLRGYCTRRIRGMGEAFGDLFGIVKENLDTGRNDNDIARIFDRAADSVCVNCKNKEECWQKEYLDTLAVMNDATAAMMERGKLDREDLAKRFLDRCPYHYAFIAAVNGELRGLVYRRQFRSRLEENRAAAYGQYADMEEVLKTAAAELSGASGPDYLAQRRILRYLSGLDIEASVSVFRDKGGRLRVMIDSGRINALCREPEYLDKLSAAAGVRLCRPGNKEGKTDGKLLLLEAEPLAVSVGIAAMKKKGESISGDRGTYFKTDEGILCVILSDGMGSGEEAARESVGVVRILEKFLRAGIAPATSMKILNSVMLLKNGDEWGYATVDLVCIDLFTGETSFYKYGAAPSYVKNGKAIKRVRGESLAAGIFGGDGSAPDVVKMKLKPGSLAIIASDGVLVEDDDRWLRDIMHGFDGDDTKALARSTLQTAIREYGCQDDMTVLAIRVDARA